MVVTAYGGKTIRFRDNRAVSRNFTTAVRPNGALGGVLEDLLISPHFADPAKHFMCSVGLCKKGSLSLASQN
jgi:hypothetical protein